MKVYTRGGDTGETSLFGAERVRKDHPRVEAYGTVDVLNAVLGLAVAELEAGDLCDWLGRIQASLFDLGSELATPDVEDREQRGKTLVRIGSGEVGQMEQWIDRLDLELEPLKNFVLPGGTRLAALLHLARTVCRRAEREVVRLGETEKISGDAVRYLNRLSDLLFVMARAANHRAGVKEPTWTGRER